MSQRHLYLFSRDQFTAFIHACTVVLTAHMQATAVRTMCTSHAKKIYQRAASLLKWGTVARPTPTWSSCWALMARRLEDHVAEKGASSLQAFDRQLADAALMTTETGVLKDNMRSGA